MSCIRIVVLLAIAYYGLMALVYMGREVEGEGFGKTLKMGVFAYYVGMIMLYLDREVLSGVEVVPDARENQPADAKASAPG